jgi:hypothetical protein
MTPEVSRLSALVQRAGAPAAPTVLLVREVPMFEIEFAALEFAEEVKLPSCDWAVLALARALGELTPRDVDGYLGLGATVSGGLVSRLTDEALLEAVETLASPPQPSVAESGLGAFLRRMLGMDLPAPTLVTARRPTRARVMGASAAAEAPRRKLSAAGEIALERGAAAHRRLHSARLLFWSAPLHFAGIADEKRQKFTQHRRAKPLDADQVPEVFRELDGILSLRQGERDRRCGIGEGLADFAGRLVGVNPGSQWEVRPERETHRGQLVLAAFRSSDPGGLRWQAFTGAGERLGEAAHLDPHEIGDGHVASADRIMEMMATRDDLSRCLVRTLRPDGAFDVLADASSILRLLGDADKADDTLITIARDADWSIAVRVHAVPADEDAAEAAYLALLKRRTPALRCDFDGTCRAVSAHLRAYWGEIGMRLPTPDDAAVLLWDEPAMRGALCARRLDADLVSPYRGAPPEAP